VKRIVLASGNPGKIREITALLAPLSIEVVPQSKLGIEEADEPHDTFLENALAKARHASRAAGLPALADDSGLCVDALGGAPGVHSAYYAGREGNREQRDARNNARLLASLKDNRKAHYTCVIVFLENFQKTPLVAEGIWRGEIARAPRGANGFGYDPIFFHAGAARTFAELTRAEKEALSHRGEAIRRLVAAVRSGALAL
jgi:XTP/dITP diphosphohydrolase